MREYPDRIVEPPEPRPVLCDCGHWQHEVDGYPVKLGGETICDSCFDSGRIFDEDDEE